MPSPHAPSHSFDRAPPSRAWALVPLLFYVVHASWYAVHGGVENMLWACHVGCLLIALGLATRWPRGPAIGLSWLCFGTPMWLYSLATSEHIVPTSILPHAGGPIVGAWAVSRLGFPAGTWWRATAGAIALQCVSRALTSVRANVNLSQTVWGKPPGSALTHVLFVLAVDAAATCVFVAIEWLARRALQRSSASTLTS